MPALPVCQEAGKETPGRIRLFPPRVRIPVSGRHLPTPSIDGLERRPLEPPPVSGRVIHPPDDVISGRASPDDGARGPGVVQRPQAREVSPPVGRHRPVLARFHLSGAGWPPVVVEAMGTFRCRGDGVLVESTVCLGAGAGEARVEVLSGGFGGPFLVPVDVGITGARALPAGWGYVLHLLVDDVHGDGAAVGPVLQPVPLVLCASSLGSGAPAAFGYGEPGREEEGEDRGLHLLLRRLWLILSGGVWAMLGEYSLYIVFLSPACKQGRINSVGENLL
jgi:hypothetical protein